MEREVHLGHRAGHGADAVANPFPFSVNRNRCDIVRADGNLVRRPETVRVGGDCGDEIAQPSVDEISDKDLRARVRSNAVGFKHASAHVRARHHHDEGIQVDRDIGGLSGHGKFTEDRPWNFTAPLRHHTEQSERNALKCEPPVAVAEQTPAQFAGIRIRKEIHRHALHGCLPVGGKYLADHRCAAAETQRHGNFGTGPRRICRQRIAQNGAVQSFVYCFTGGFGKKDAGMAGSEVGKT